MKKANLLILFSSIFILAISCKKSKPIASFKILNEKKYSPAEIYFKNESENAEEYFWDFGDGTTSMDQNPIHVFQNPGDYIVALKAKKNNFRSAEFSKTLSLSKGYTGARVSTVYFNEPFFIAGEKYVVKINQVASEPLLYSSGFGGSFNFTTPVTLLLNNSFEKIELCKYSEIINPEPSGPTISIAPIAFNYFKMEKELNIEKFDNYPESLTIFFDYGEVNYGEMTLLLNWY